jgi:hypothetical protein
MLNFSTMPSVGRMAVMAASFLSIANAHMYIAEPKPLPGNAIKNPLDPSGSDFPCHGAALPSSGGQKISAGSSFPLQLALEDGANTAVHGGGSCQLSITYETDPVKVKDPKNWHVIYSIEGGCPSNTAANLDSVPGGKAVACVSNDEGDCVHSWDVPMPKGVNPGNAVLAWSWQNTLGNREFYMGCSAVSIDGGSGDEMDSLPALFVANLEIEGGKCPTTASQDVLYPNPGKYVTTMSATNGKNWPKATPTGEGCGGSGGSPAQPTGYGSGSSSEAAPSSSAYAQPTGYGSPSQAAPTSIASHVSSLIASYDNQKGRETQTTFATLTSTQQQSVAAPTAEAPAPTGYSSGSPNAESNSTSSGTSCPEDGALICIGSDSFGICDHGSAVSRPLAQGTVCKDGVISGANRFRRHVHGAHKH